MAVLHARGQLAIGQDFVHEGILGTIFTGRLLAQTTARIAAGGGAELTGTGWITGFTQYVIDHDPFPDGFTVGDLWA